MDDTAATPPPAEAQELELADEDILDAMQRIPGYLDITTGDFRELYHLAYRHAIDRLLGGLRAQALMRPVAALAPGMMLDEAARALVASGVKAMPVTDPEGRVLGMLTETDFLRRLQVDTFLELLLQMIEDSCKISHRCHETPVSAAMTAPAVTLGPQADFRAMTSAFGRHAGRSTPVVDADGRLLGLLLRKDFLAALDRQAHA